MLATKNGQTVAQAMSPECLVDGEEATQTKDKWNEAGISFAGYCYATKSDFLKPDNLQSSNQLFSMCNIFNPVTLQLSCRIIKILSESE